MSYIVKNCPCAYGFIDAPMYCLWKDETLTYNTLCQDCTDCVIKQVIEKCTNAINTTFNNECFELAKEVTNLFDIEEVNK